MPVFRRGCSPESLGAIRLDTQKITRAVTTFQSFALSSNRMRIFFLSSTFLSTSSVKLDRKELYCSGSSSLSTFRSTVIPSRPRERYSPPPNMSGTQPVMLYGLKVPPGDILVAGAQELPAMVSSIEFTLANYLRSSARCSTLTLPSVPRHNGSHRSH